MNAMIETWQCEQIIQRAKSEMEAGGARAFYNVLALASHMLPLSKLDKTFIEIMAASVPDIDAETAATALRDGQKYVDEQTKREAGL